MILSRKLFLHLSRHISDCSDIWYVLLAYPLEHLAQADWKPHKQHSHIAQTNRLDQGWRATGCLLGLSFSLPTTFIVTVYCGWQTLSVTLTPVAMVFNLMKQLRKSQRPQISHDRPKLGGETLSMHQRMTLLPQDMLVGLEEQSIGFFPAIHLRDLLLLRSYFRVDTLALCAVVIIVLADFRSSLLHSQ